MNAPSNLHLSIVLPRAFQEQIENTEEEAIIKNFIALIEPNYIDNRLHFFKDYTDHSSLHIQEVLDAASDLMPIESIEILDAKNIFFIVASILLHDIGMQLSFDGFKKILNGYYDDVRVEYFDTKTWAQEWAIYNREARKFDEKQIENIFGKPIPSSFCIPQIDINSIIEDELDGFDRKFIGEFIRRNHARLAHEVALKGLPGNKDIEFVKELSISDKDIIGLIARSHNMNVRETFSYLKTYDDNLWHTFNGIYIVYLMIVLRLSDLIQIQSTRASSKKLNFRSLSSPMSRQEWATHESVNKILPSSADKEAIHAFVNPSSSKIFLKIHYLLQYIQYELDISWAIIGEVYSKTEPSKRLYLSYRRITSNIDNIKNYQEKINYIPIKARFESSNELQKLLIAPLYGNNPTYGVRELLQNAVDACRARKHIDNKDYKPQIKITISNNENKEHYFTIRDNGIGMNLDTIVNYFLKAGATYRKSSNWQSDFVDDNGKSTVQRTGRFGIGALSVFLLGDKLKVTTKNRQENTALQFESDLDSEQIEIVKTTFDVGTEINIKLNDYVYESLFNQYIGQGRGRFVYWQNWYTLESPSIDVTVPKYWDDFIEENYNHSNESKKHYLPSFDSKLKHNEYAFFPEGINKVIWSYAYTRPLLTCNGFVITEGYRFYSESHPSLTKTPLVMVYDYDGNFPLTLNRNMIEGEHISFESDLTTEIYKDIIAYALCMPALKPTKDNIFINYDILSHPALHESISYRTHNNNIQYRVNRIIFTDKGFTFSTSNCIKKLKIKSITEIWTKGKPINNMLNLPSSQQAYIFHKADLLIEVTPHDSYTSVESYRSAFIRHPKDNDNFLLHRNLVVDNSISKLKIINFEKTFKNNNHFFNRYKHDIIETNEQWITINIQFDSKKRKISKNNLQVLNHINEHYNYDYIKGISITNISDIKEPSTKEDMILENLIERYLGSNLMIPYKYEDRKKLYPLAFQELKSNIESHLLNMKNTEQDNC